MIRRLRRCFASFVAAYVFAWTIFYFSQGQNLTLEVMASFIDTHWRPYTYDKEDSYWTIPGDSSSLLPSINSSIDVYIDLDKFRQQVMKKNKDCWNLTEDPTTMFRSQPSNTTNFTVQMDFNRIYLAIQCGGLLYPEFLKAIPREELYPFEAFYLFDPPLWDESTVACHKHSTINLTGSSTSFVVGDAVAFVITMFDTVGRPRLKGGDRIQVWLKDVKLQHSISAKITDFNNGTYLATTVLPWAGTVRVMATLRQPREYFRALAYLHRAIKSTMGFYGGYENSKASEAVPCNPFPIVPGFEKSELCNFTSENGSPWYCGRPSKPELNCSDYMWHMTTKFFFYNPVTPAEDKLLQQPAFQRNFLAGNISFNVTTTKSGMTRLKDPDVSCNLVSPRSTWHQAVPPGYFYNKVWKPFLCSTPEKVDTSCFKNVHMIFYGDSNARESYYNIVAKIRCQQTVYDQEQSFHSAKLCENKTLNFSLRHITHANPFQTGWGRFANKNLLHPPQNLLGSIPSTGRHIIIFTHYLHFTFSHISAFERALIAARDAIAKLLKRNPQVLILLRGPHVAEHRPATFMVGDAWAQYFTTIQRHTFRHLQDSVIYFPTWDITVASEDTTIHPSCNKHITDVMLHFLCGRNK